jgi:hypothetical protein
VSLQHHIALTLLYPTLDDRIIRPFEMPDEDMLKLALQKHACFVRDLRDFSTFARYLNKDFADKWLEAIHKAYSGLQTAELDNNLILAEELFNLVQQKAIKAVEHLEMIASKTFGHYIEVMAEFGFVNFENEKSNFVKLSDHLMQFHFIASSRIEPLSKNGFTKHEADNLGNLSAELQLAYTRMKELKENKSIQLRTLNITIHAVWSKTSLICEAGSVIYKKNKEKLKNYVLNTKIMNVVFYFTALLAQ